MHQPSNPLGFKYFNDDAMKFSAIGDWCLGSKVEDAFTSGYSLAKHLNAELSERIVAIWLIGIMAI